MTLVFSKETITVLITILDCIVCRHNLNKAGWFRSNFKTFARFVLTCIDLRVFADPRKIPRRLKR